MIKINNNIILEIDGKFFDTFETDMSEISNKNKKKYKNVTKTILKLQDIYGIENEVNYILILNSKNLDELSGGELSSDELSGGKNNGGIKKIVFDRKFLGGSGWDGAQDGGIEQEEKEEEEIQEQEGGKWGSHSEPFTVQAGGQWTGSMPPVEDSSR